MKHLLSLTFFALAAWAYASANHSPLVSDFGKMNEKPGFEENIGQVYGNDGHRVKFRLQHQSSTIFLLNNAVAYQFTQLHQTEAPNVLFENIAEKARHTRYSTYRMDMQLVGANPNPRISKLEKLSHFNRYSSVEMEQAHFFEKIIYHDIYPNIDWVFFINSSGIKHEFVVHPGGDPNLIKFEAKWAEKMQLGAHGNLILENRLGVVTENKPISFQGKQIVGSEFILKGHHISYKIADYNRNETLIIDPQLIWSTYYGGPGVESANSVTSDTQGNVYFCGSTQSFSGIADGGFINTYTGGGAFAAFLVKFNPAGQRVWGTYYGTQGFISNAFACVADAQDNIYLAGFTDDLTTIAFNGHQNSFGGASDGFLAKFNTNGGRIWSTYFGGLQNETILGADVDNQGNVFVTGRTSSSNNIAFSAYQPIPGEDIEQSDDAFLAKFNPNGGLLWSTYFGGSGSDLARDVAVDANGNAYITGNTRSPNNISLNGHQNTPQINVNALNTDAFLAKFSATGNLLWGTYYGGSRNDNGLGVTTDALGNVYISGATESTNNIFFNGFQSTFPASGSSCFLVKFDEDGTRLWGTYFSGTSADLQSFAVFARSCATDSEGNVYIAGRTNATSGVAFQGFQNSYGGSSVDGFLAKFDPSGNRIWASYLGGSQSDVLDDIHVDNAGQIYVCGSTTSPNNIFFQGFQNLLQFEDCIVAKIGCPNPSIFNLPQEVCANTSLQLNPLPTGGNLQLNGIGSLAGNTFNAPEVSAATEVSFTYSINASGQCPAASNSFSLTIQPNISPILSITSSELVICDGEEITFNATLANAGDNPTINWLVNNESVAQNTLTYASSTLQNNAQVQSVVQSNATCANPSTVNSNSIFVTVNPNSSSSLILSPINGGTLIADPGLFNYQWFFNGQMLPGESNSFLKPKEIGVYTLIVTNEFGCSTSQEITVNSISVSINKTPEKTVRIYPNPALNGWLAVEGDGNYSLQITLVNALGAIVHQTQSYEAITLIPTGHLASGIYRLSLEGEGKRFNSKVVIKNE